MTWRFIVVGTLNSCKEECDNATVVSQCSRMISKMNICEQYAILYNIFII